MFDIFFNIIGTLLGIILPIICLYWVFKPPECFWEEHKNISSFIFFGAFLSCAIIFGFGFQSYLWFIPENWRFSLSSIISFFIILCLFMLLRKVSLQNQQYRIEENMRLLKEQRKNRLISAKSEEDRAKILADCRTAKDTLEQINDSITRRTYRLTPEEKRQQNVLKILIGEYDDMISLK
jgi:hypothetical protein